MMKCFECDKTVQVKKYKAYLYDRVGLDNVCLLNQRVEVCQYCRTETPLLKNVGRLHRTIGLGIALQPAPMSGPELRYLRRSAKIASGEMAAALLVSEETYSKWENNKRQITPNADKMARLLYLTALEQQNAESYIHHVSTVVKMDMNGERGYMIAVNAQELDQPVKYLPKHVAFGQPTVIESAFLMFEWTSVDTVTGLARLDARGNDFKDSDYVGECFAPAA